MSGSSYSVLRDTCPAARRGAIGRQIGEGGVRRLRYRAAGLVI
jgi:hypothetical protein